MELTNRFDQALTYAVLAQGRKLRKGTDVPYLSHLLMVAALALEYGGSEDEAIAALLHDVIEDEGPGHINPIRDRFGADVLGIVLGCTDTKDSTEARSSESSAQRKRAYLEHLRTERNRSVLFVSCCDKLANARSIVKDYREVGEELWKRFNVGRTQTLRFYADLADVYRARLGTAVSDEFVRVVSAMHALAREATA